MRVMIISLRSLVVGAIIFVFLLIAGIVLLVKDPLDVTSSYTPSSESVLTSSQAENHPFSSEKPSLALDVNLDGSTAEVKMITKNFQFVKPDGKNQEVTHGQGHAHLYLDGQLIYQAFQPELVIKNLPKGEHELRVELNYNNHMSYKVEKIQMLQIK